MNRIIEKKYQGCRLSCKTSLKRQRHLKKKRRVNLNHDRKLKKNLQDNAKNMKTN